ncbi:TetR family transcriptional regulator [Sinomonas sp. G460-2]|uniref:TetR family transcriptional regulator n=1 Tax=Sinomonas sp. G460-2 TaxID=3393464 RepID=UPI0039EF30EA
MQQGTGTRGRYAKTAERRAAVARAALDIVTEKGHKALTTAEVASRAGMSETALMYHFPTRDHVLIAAMELSDEENISRLTAESIANELSTGDWDPAGAARLVLTEDKTIRLLLALEAEAPNPEHPAHQYMKKHNENAILTTAANIKRRQAEGRAHPALDPVSTARQMMAVWSGLRAQWLIDPSFDFANQVAVAFRALTGEALMDTRKKIERLIASV